MKRLARHAVAVVWAAFLTACMLEVLVFAFVDPLALHTLSGEVLQLSPMGIYTLAFLALWAVCAVGCSLTVLLTVPAARIVSTRFR